MNKLDCPFRKLSLVYLLNYLHRPKYPLPGQNPCSTLLYANTIAFPYPSMQFANLGYMNEHTQMEDNMLLGGWEVDDNLRFLTITEPT